MMVFNFGRIWVENGNSIRTIATIVRSTVEVVVVVFGKNEIGRITGVLRTQQRGRDDGRSCVPTKSTRRELGLEIA